MMIDHLYNGILDEVNTNFRLLYNDRYLSFNSCEGVCLLLNVNVGECIFIAEHEGGECVDCRM